jgi:hypothetical protein
LLPECLDDWIDESNPVRAMDAYVDALDLAKLGFEGVAPEVTGRPSYHPSALLKLYIYGYLNRVQSSRRRRVVQIPDVRASGRRRAAHQQHRILHQSTPATRGRSRPGMLCRRCIINASTLRLAA